MRVRPLQDRVLVERIDAEETTRGGIVIPDTAKEKPQTGRVLAVGKGKVTEQGKRLPLTVKRGDKVLFGRYSGSEVNVDGAERLLLRQDDILAILE
jgi:chaperonin GroES